MKIFLEIMAQYTFVKKKTRACYCTESLQFWHLDLLEWAVNVNNVPKSNLKTHAYSVQVIR